MFDKSKPYGECHGVNCKFKYIQDKKFYLVDGTEVNEDGSLVKKDNRKKDKASDVS